MAIIEAFFASVGARPDDDYFSHLCAPDESLKMHIVLDVHAKTIPTVDLCTIAYKVFKVKKDDHLYVVLLLKLINTNQEFSYFRELNDSACKQARQRCNTLSWGTDRNHPEESDGVRLAQ